MSPDDSIADEVLALMEVKMEQKPGWKTTEFWGTHMTQVITVLATVLSIVKLNLTPEQQTALVALGGGIVGTVQAFYTKGRSDVKVAQIQADSK